MARDGDLPTIFNPMRVRAPSVIITSDDNPERMNGPSSGAPGSPRALLTPQTSLSSVPPLPSQQGYSESAGSSQDEPLNDSGCPRTCCSELAKKMYYGVCMTVLLTVSWVLATHSIKFLYLEHPARGLAAFAGAESPPDFTNHTLRENTAYNAPFFTTWFCTSWLLLVYPLHALAGLARCRCRASECELSACSHLRQKGFTLGRFLSRCGLFCLLWVTTTYMYIYSLRILLATDAAAVFATNVSCIYLLSWVILHEQFVGIRIVAAILCDTGIALLAYMDGITGSPTLGGVVLVAVAAAGFAIFKVLFRKVMGEVDSSQRALFLSLVGLINVIFLWPICLALYLTGAEALPVHRLSWLALLTAGASLLVFHLVYQFGSAVTYNMFVTLGLITAVPVSAALDVVLYSAQFEGMKLAGVILIAVGFFLVMFPDNWPEYIMRLLKWSRRQRGRGCGSRDRSTVDYRTGYIRSHLRSPSGRVR